MEGEDIRMRGTIKRLAVGLTVFAGLTTVQVARPAEPTPFVLSSPDKQLTVSIPEIYMAKVFGCHGGNMSPEFEWSGVPAGTKSFVITLFDGDVHDSPSGWWHWVLYDVPATVTKLPMGAGSERKSLMPAGAVEARTDLGTEAYHGPCPDKGDPPHHYIFTIYAVGVAKLHIPPGASGAMVTSMALGNLKGKAVLVGRLGR
jgi:Raf kinase inhibitor-like YbhB/YbcL family protein